MKKWRLGQSGATIIEFALVAPIFFLLLLGIIEFGLIGFSQVAIESAVAGTAREASLGKVASGGTREDYIVTHIRKKLDGLINSEELVISVNTVLSGGVQAVPDICMDDPPRMTGNCNPPLSYEEVNGIPGYQSSSSINVGNAGDLIEVRVFYPWRIQFPLMKQFFGENGVFMITANAIVKNEPF
jgi:hypothetical protein